MADTSSFGRKMLEKMGWKSGEGLGLNNDGTTSHIKIALKDDNLGIGASRKDAETGWLNNSKSYQEVLDRLSKSCHGGGSDKEKKEKKDMKVKKKEHKDKKGKMKEEKKDKKEKKEKKDKKEKKEKESQPSQPTILKSAHRAKFIRNKAVSSYSEANLKEILGGFSI